MHKATRPHAHALFHQVDGLVALTHGVLVIHARLLAILGRLLLAVLSALALAVFRAGLAGGTAVVLIHDYHLTKQQYAPSLFLYTKRKNFYFNATHPLTFML